MVGTYPMPGHDAGDRPDAVPLELRSPPRPGRRRAQGGQHWGPFNTATQARYPRLVEQLGTSRMPDAALVKVADALNSEPLPSADPMADLLLDTAGLHRALEIYRANHTADQQ